MYNENGIISRDAAEQAIKGGGSVLIKGKLYNRIESLPTDAELAMLSGDPTGVERVRQEKQAEIDRLTADLAALKKPAKAHKDDKKPDGDAGKEATADDLEALTKEQLLEKAKDAGLTGVSALNKGELVEAIKNAGK